MTRDLRLLAFGVEQGDDGPQLVAHVASAHLKGQPVDAVPLDEDDAIKMIEQLAGGLASVRRGRR